MQQILKEVERKKSSSPHTFPLRTAMKKSTCSQAHWGVGKRRGEACIHMHVTHPNGPTWSWFPRLTFSISLKSSSSLVPSAPPTFSLTSCNNPRSKECFNKHILHLYFCNCYPPPRPVESLNRHIFSFMNHFAVLNKCEQEHGWADSWATMPSKCNVL